MFQYITLVFLSVFQISMDTVEEYTAGLKDKPSGITMQLLQFQFI